MRWWQKAEPTATNLLDVSVDYMFELAVDLDRRYRRDGDEGPAPLYDQLDAAFHAILSAWQYDRDLSDLPVEVSKHLRENWL